MFVAIDGIDGSGKSTVATSVARILIEHGIETTVIEHPGDGLCGSICQRMLVRRGVFAKAMSATFLFADMLTSVHRIHRCRKNGVVIAVRYSLSCLYLDGFPGRAVFRLFNAFMPAPDHLIMIDTDPFVASRRIDVRGSETEMFDDLESMRLVRDKMLAVQRVTVVDGNVSPEEVTHSVLDIMGLLRDGLISIRVSRPSVNQMASKNESKNKLELIPVEDIKVTKGMTVDQMLRAMGRAGGFTAQKLADATDIAEAMVSNKKCLKILSFPACIMATGTRGVIVDMVKNHMVDLIITTCGTLDHDLSRTFKAYYKGDFMMDDAMLRDEYEISRLGNVLVPDECYGVVLEDELLPMFDEIFAGKDSLTTHEIIDEVGARLNNEDSLLYQCHKNGVPIVVPGITDGSFGCQLWMYYQMHRKLRIDLFGDEQMLSEMTNDAEATGAIIIGGGISKHHVIWWNQFRGGLDYCIYLTTAEEYDGSLSGARIREAVSWGKVKEQAKKMTVEGDATITLPIIYAGLAERLL